MKTFKILFAFIAALVILTGCPKDEPEYDKPVVSFDKTSPLILEKDQAFIASGFPYALSLSVTIKAEGKIKTTTVNVYEGENGSKNDVKSTAFTKAVNGDRNETTFAFPLTDVIVDASSLPVKYEIIIVDKENQETKAYFTVQGNAVAPTTYWVTFSCGEPETVIAVSDLNGVVGSEIVSSGVAKFKLEEGSYNFTATKDGYTMTAPASNSFTVIDDNNPGTIAVTMTAVSHSLVETQNVGIIVPTNTGGSSGPATTYNGTTYTDVSNVIMGIQFHTLRQVTTTSVVAEIHTTTGNNTLVEVSSYDYTTVEEIQALYDSPTATKVNSVDLVDILASKGLIDKDINKYFVSKVGEDYVLLKAKSFHRPVSGQNVLLFDYKK